MYLQLIFMERNYSIAVKININNKDTVDQVINDRL